MATGEPLIETAIQSIRTALQSIIVANSYRTNVALVSRILKAHDELDINEYPALFVALGDCRIENQTNKEVKKTYPITIYGYVKFDDYTDDHDTNSAQSKLIKLSADVQEKMYDQFQTDQFNASTEELNGGSFASDEGALEPYAIFMMDFELVIEHAYNDASRRVNN